MLVGSNRSTVPAGMWKKDPGPPSTTLPSMWYRSVPSMT